MKTITIDGVTYVQQQSEVSDYVIVRTYSAGVHFGIVTKREGKEVTLKNSRRIWYWDGAASLSQMALEGVKNPDNCKFAVALPEILLLEAIEIIPCTAAARDNILAVKEWRAE